MNKNPNKITEMPYAKWLEQSLRDMTTFQVRGIALAVLTDNNETCTSYYNVGMTDKLVISGVISQDATIDMLEANGVINYEDDIDDEEEDTDGEEK